MSRRAEQPRRLRGEEGQALIVMVATLIVLLGFVAIVIDIGRVYLAQRQLQQAVDAAALVAGQTLPNATNAKTQALAYSATGYNKHPYDMVAGAPTITFKCLSTLAARNVPCNPDSDPGATGSKPCIGTTGSVATCNAVQVIQSATVPTTFARLFIPSLKVTARSTAGMRGGVPHPFDIMIVLDRTGSMGEACNSNVNDANGNVIIPSGSSTKIDCAKDGVRQLLKGLLPCNTNVNGACGNAQPLDKVGMMVFPPLNAPTDTNHDQGTPAVPPTAAVNEVDRLNVSGNPRDNSALRPSFFSLTVNGQTTGSIAWPTTGTAIKNALVALPNVGANDVTVTPTDNNDPWTVTFSNALGGQDVAFTATNSLRNGSIDVQEVTRGAAAVPGTPALPPSRTNLMLNTTASCSHPAGTNTWPTWYTPKSNNYPGWFDQTSDVGYGTAAVAPVPGTPEVDRLTVSSSPSGGYFTMTVDTATSNPVTSGHVNWPITTAAIQTELNNMVGASNVTVASGPGGSPANPVWTVTFNSTLGDVNFTVAESLTSGSIAATEITKGDTGSPGSPAIDPDYTFAPLSNTYRLQDAPGLNANSLLVNAITWASCPGGTTNGIASETSAGYPGNEYYGVNALGNTYYTGALQAAQQALAAEQAAHPRGAQPVIIFLSDGQANTGGANPCTTAMTAAQNAAAAGTWLYSIAYNVSVSPFNSDTYCQYPFGTRERTAAFPNGVTAYHTLAQIARISASTSDPSKFFCVGTPSQAGEPCQDASTLNEVFQSIGTSLTAPRLYPDDTN